MRLKILTPEKQLYHGHVTGFTVKTLAGEITILGSHEPIISMFEKGTATIIDNENKHHPIELNSGFLEMTPENDLNVLTE